MGTSGSGGNAGDYGSDDLYTLPGDARRFAEETEVASLAVAIGSAHGVYVKTPKLSIARPEGDRRRDADAARPPRRQRNP